MQLTICLRFTINLGAIRKESFGYQDAFLAQHSFLVVMGYGILNLMNLFPQCRSEKSWS